MMSLTYNLNHFSENMKKLDDLFGYNLVQTESYNLFLP